MCSFGLWFPHILCFPHISPHELQNFVIAIWRKHSCWLEADRHRSHRHETTGNQHEVAVLIQRTTFWPSNPICFSCLLESTDIEARRLEKKRKHIVIRRKKRNLVDGWSFCEPSFGGWVEFLRIALTPPNLPPRIKMSRKVPPTQKTQVHQQDLRLSYRGQMPRGDGGQKRE